MRGILAQARAAAKLRSEHRGSRLGCRHDGQTPYVVMECWKATISASLIEKGALPIATRGRSQSAGEHLDRGGGIRETASCTRSQAGETVRHEPTRWLALERCSTSRIAKAMTAAPSSWRIPTSYGDDGHLSPSSLSALVRSRAQRTFWRSGADLYATVIVADDGCRGDDQAMAIRVATNRPSARSVARSGFVRLCLKCLEKRRPSH